MNPTVLVYSSHQRCHRLHHDHIVRRALAGNRRILFVAMAETVQHGDEMARQVESWESFRWYFDQFRGEGLEASPFYWSSGLKQGDVDLLWRLLWESEVVVLGGGGSANGMGRFLELGARFAGEPGKFGRLLHERQARGLLTAGYSAGADQLCSYLFRRTENLPCDAFGLLRDTMISLHHEPGFRDGLREKARRVPDVMLFGVPNDSGLLGTVGTTPKGNRFQMIDFVIDNSWDRPEDQWHIRTRQGALIDHYYPDGRLWAFRDGHALLRITSPDRRYDEAWIAADGRIFHYASQQPAPAGSFGEIIASR